MTFWKFEAGHDTGARIDGLRVKDVMAIRRSQEEEME